jgi:hypothetical protein
MKTPSAVVSWLFCLSSTVYAQTMLTPEQVKSEMAGYAMLAKTNQGQVFDFTMLANGTIKTDSFGGDKGVWRLSADGYCATWDKIRAGKEACFQISKPLLNLIVHGADGNFSTITQKDPVP